MNYWPFSVLLSLILVFSLADTPMVSAAEDVGGATKIVRTVTGRLAGATARLGRGDRVFRNQRLRAGRSSFGQFRFNDSTRLALNANSSVTLDRFVYSGNGGASELIMKAARGAFRFGTGNMPSKSYRIITPSSTIGVRGTLFDVYVGGRGQTIVTLLYGAVEACNTSGSCRTLNQQCQSVRIEPDGRFVSAGRPDQTILAGAAAQQAIPFLLDQYELARSLRVPGRVAARCSGTSAADPDANNDGASGDGGGGSDNDSDGGGAGSGTGGSPGSDIRLKREIAALEQLPNGLTLYRFKYTWSDKEWVGVMAQDVLKVRPEAVSTGPEGFYRVNYQMLGLKMVPYQRWLASRDEHILVSADSVE